MDTQATEPIGQTGEEQDVAVYFGRELLGWYDMVKRVLPWRQNRDPYRVWVSEIMLQQTRVDTVIPYYERFMARFPTVQALAEAPEEDVLKHWEGLGYYSRARNLQAGAREVVSQYRGIVPDDAAAVASLKGVGPYTAGAIMSIAFNRPEPAVDGNVMRVLSRFWELEDDIAKPATRVRIEKLARSIIPEGRAGDFNQALMELGALVCTPKSPGCLTCPVMQHCAGRLAGKELVLPIKTKAKPPRPEHRLGVIVAGSGEHVGQVLVRQRPDTGLLAKMWELPHVLVSKDAEKAIGSKGRKKGVPIAEELLPKLAGLLARTLHEEEKLLVRLTGYRAEADHVFSHIHWTMDVFEADMPAVAGGEAGQPVRSDLAAETVAMYGVGDGGEEAQGPFVGDLPAGYRWIGQEALDTLAFPNLFLRLLHDYWGITGRG
ncbi:A/G-specific adenine glycosylase [Paenibacillus sp. MMS18-CY102]|uniref:A/G-specific adenine glycosylase n=1 Tax=Paenibacillus sp. MMS18-CY102 TaxID=2682849 RepID=UPI0013662D18|nr:A/G-specific adenine glycosylase [Paenibacillus sp. MMS18-CY102]MWC30323.1 A/G-specific adenine glycosylase [Paenibacillus sp. MMS18-CY102]